MLFQKFPKESLLSKNLGCRQEIFRHPIEDIVYNSSRFVEVMTSIVGKVEVITSIVGKVDCQGSWHSSYTAAT